MSFFWLTISLVFSLYLTFLMILIIIQPRGKHPLKRKKNVRIAPSKKCKVSSLKVFLYFVFQSCQLHPLCVIQIVLASSQDFTFFRHARPLQHHFEFLELARPWGHHLQIGLPFLPNSNSLFLSNSYKIKTKYPIIKFGYICKRKGFCIRRNVDEKGDVNWHI